MSDEYVLLLDELRRIGPDAVRQRLEALPDFRWEGSAARTASDWRTICGSRGYRPAVAAMIRGALFEPLRVRSGPDAGYYLGARVVRVGDRLVMVRPRLVHEATAYPRRCGEEAVCSRRMEAEP